MKLNYFKKLNPFKKYCKFYFKNKSYLSDIKVVKHEAILTIILIEIIGILMNFIYALSKQGADLSTFINGTLLFISIIMLYIIGKFEKNRKYVNTFYTFFFIASITNYVIDGGYLNNGLNMFWAGLVVIIVLIHSTYKASILWMIGFILTLIISFFIEIFAFNNQDYMLTASIIVNILLIIAGLFISIRFLLLNIYKIGSKSIKLQSDIVEKEAAIAKQEKTMALSELISSISREINTPFSAIKASSDICADSLENVINNFEVIAHSRPDNQDVRIVKKLLKLILEESKTNMKTEDIRKTKKNIMDIFETNNIENPEEVVTALFELGTYNTEAIKQNIDIFKKKDIITTLKSIVPFYDIINGIYIIQKSTQKTAKLLNSLKSFIDDNNVNKAMKFDLTVSINNVLNLYSYQSASIELIKDFETIPQIFGRKDELNQVWVNIISNSIYAMNKKGTLSVTIRNLNNKYVRISIKDTGNGIEPENISKVFDPLFTTKPTGEGSGFGLNVSKKIVENHKGSITIDSAIDIGTTIIVTLPV